MYRTQSYKARPQSILRVYEHSEYINHFKAGFSHREDYRYYIHPNKQETNNLNFHPLEVVSRYRDPQPQVGENYSHSKHLQILMIKHLLHNQY